MLGRREPMFSVGKGYLIAGGVAAYLFSVLLAYWLGQTIGDTTGSARCQVAQATAQVKNVEKVHKTYDKIDHRTPFAGDKSARIKWLFENAAGNGH